ncbi:MAG: hypothetical protein IPJ34_00980 [Myxococcales bacterium]|nr:hypothetical protein [Myxococcales bacterium]
MDRLLARLERRFGWLSLPNTAAWVVGVWAITFALTLAKPELPLAMYFDPALVLRGQVWRVISAFFIPSSGSVLFFIFMVSFNYWILSSLEEHWGSFKLGVYLTLGWGLCVAAGFILRMPITAAPMHLSLAMAFGILFPEAEIRLYFLIPVKAKWLALLDFGLMIYMYVLYDKLDGPVLDPLRVSFGATMIGFLLFFGGHLVGLLRGQAVVLRQQTERSRFAPEPERKVRSCVQCGKSDEDPDVDLRVCNCQEFCGGKATVYCLEHARSHNKH